MNVARRLAAQGSDELDLPRRRRQQVDAAHHFGDAHGEVVHHHGELVAVEAIAALEDDVSHLLGHVLETVAVDAVFEIDAAGLN